jgi:hypothetical protein
MKRLARYVTMGCGIGAFAITGLFLCNTAIAFEAAPPVLPFSVQDGAYLECAIVKHTADHDRDPPFKINIGLRVNNGTFEGLDVTYTLVSGRVVDRSQQYLNGKTWTAMPRTYDWWWGGTRGNVTNVGHLYHNDRDGWMYNENITDPRGLYQMLADCHELAG